jgi:protein transport protein SEC24
MKLRCSPGFVVESYYGVGQPTASPDEIELSGIDREVTSCYALRQTGSIPNGEPMYLQLAILYTSLPSSQRIVRVHNLQLYCSSEPAVVFKHADVDCLVTYFTKLSIFTMLHTPPPTHTLSSTQQQHLTPTAISRSKPSAKEYQLSRHGTPRNPKTNVSQYLLDSCLDILLKYRQICSSHSPKGQLILPEALKILPLYTLCLMKHPALLQNNLTGGGGGGGVRGGGGASLNKADRLGVDVCERAAELNRLLRCSPQEILKSLYPRLFPLHRLQEGDGYQPEDIEDSEVSLSCTRLVSSSDCGVQEHWVVQMPTWLKSSAESIDSDGIYLLDDGEVLWLYFGRSPLSSLLTPSISLSFPYSPLPLLCA